MTALVLRLLPVLLALGYGVLAWQMSARRLAQRLARGSAPLDDPGLLPVLDRLGAALGRGPVAVRVHASPEINGLAAPDGQVFLTEGMIALHRQGAVTAEEIASVVAHEIGHVSLGHAKRRMIDYTGQSAVRGVLGLLLGRFIPGLGPYLAQTATRLIAARTSRGAEFEADEFATALLLKAGIGAGAQISLLEKLDRSGATQQGPAWFASHPPVPQRIARIRENLTRWQG